MNREGRALVAYFGYGSLVNRTTLRTDVVAAYRARLPGWRRFWQARPDPASGQPAGRQLSLLSAARAERVTIDGLLIVDRADNLPAVDARETHYRRHPLAASDIVVLDGGLPAHCPLYIYEARPAPAIAGSGPVILRSYLDAVLQGFLTEHGEAGLRRFVSETGNFQAPILDDRNAPLYPRAVTLSAGERACIEAVLADHGIVAA